MPRRPSKAATKNATATANEENMSTETIENAETSTTDAQATEAVAAADSGKVRKTPKHTLLSSKAHQLANKRLREKYADDFREFLAAARVELGVKGGSERAEERARRTADRQKARALFDAGLDVEAWPENLRPYFDAVKESRERLAKRRAEKAAQNGQAEISAENENDGENAENDGDWQ